MNKERILALADLIEKQPHTVSRHGSGFCMNYVLHSCGTPSCIAGWAAWEAKGRPEAILDGPLGYVENIASEYLSIGVFRSESGEVDEEGLPDQLFYPERNLNDITPAQAAACLRHLAETGEVDWDRAMGVAA